MVSIVIIISGRVSQMSPGMNGMPARFARSRCRKQGPLRWQHQHFSPTTNVSKDPDDSMLPKIFHGGRSKVQALTAQHISETNVHGEGFLASNCRNLCQHSRDNCQHSRERWKQAREGGPPHAPVAPSGFLCKFPQQGPVWWWKTISLYFWVLLGALLWSCQCLQRFLGCNTLLGDLGCPGRTMLMVSQVMHRRRRWLLWCDFNCTSPLQPPSPLCCYDTHIVYCTVLRPLSHSTFFCFPICTILLHHQVGETFAETGSGLGLVGWVSASQVSTTLQLHTQMHFNGWGLVQISSKLQSHR